jgi:hypothetical protein
VAFAENRGEAPGSCGPVAEGLPSLAASVQAWGGDARRRSHSHRVFRRYAHRPRLRGRGGSILAVLLAFRRILGAGVRVAPERQRGLPEHPALHRHLPGCAGSQRDCDSGRRALLGGVLRRTVRVRDHEGEHRPPLGTASRLCARIRAARRRAAVSAGVLRDVFEGGRAPDADGHRRNRRAWRGARRAHLAHGSVQDTGHRLRQQVSRRGRQAHRGLAGPRSGRRP